MDELKSSRGSQRILVTGGAGFIGSHLADALINEGCKVTILDNLSSGRPDNIGAHLRNGDLQLLVGDIRNMSEVTKALTEVDTVFHLAAITSVPYSIENPTITNEVNAIGTRNLLERSARGNVTRFIYASSCAVYGEPRYLPIDEDHPLSPLSPYAESKMTGEEYCKGLSDECGLNTVTLRFFNVYGLRQGDNEYSGVITKLIKNIRASRSPIIFGDGEQTRDFIHVSDVVQALLLSRDSDNAVGQTFNIGLGKPVTINQLCQLVLGKMKIELKPTYKEARPGDIRHSYANIEKARRTIGFKPEISLEQGLESLTG